MSTVGIESVLVAAECDAAAVKTYLDALGPALTPALLALARRPTPRDQFQQLRLGRCVMGVLLGREGLDALASLLVDQETDEAFGSAAAMELLEHAGAGLDAALSRRNDAGPRGHERLCEVLGLFASQGDRRETGLEFLVGSLDEIGVVAALALLDYGDLRAMPLLTRWAQRAKRQATPLGAPVHRSFARGLRKLTKRPRRPEREGVDAGMVGLAAELRDAIAGLEESMEFP